MNFTKPIPWTAIDIGLLKWSCILFGMLLGAMYPEFVRRNKTGIILGIILFSILPVKKGIEYVFED